MTFDRPTTCDALRRAMAAAATAGVLLAAGCAGPRVGRSVDARSDSPPDVAAVRTAGPFYERVETSAGDVRTSLRPLLYTRIDAPRDQARLREILWPVYADRARGEHFAWRFLLAFGADFDTAKDDSRRFVWAFPFWFQGQSKDGRDYAALFPLGGTLRDFLTFDAIRFALFPLWMSTERDGVRGQSVLWPVFARAEGDGLFRWRVFPLCGYGRKEGEWERHFVLWPVWSHARYLSGPTAGYEWALVPVFGRAELGVESSWYVLPPFFQFTFGKGPNEGQRRILAPWPFVRIEDGRTSHKRHVWPLYATTWTDRSRNTHVLWPFFRHTVAKGRASESEAWSLAPLFHRSVERPVAEQTPSRGHSRPAPAATPACDRSYTRLWPLFSHVRQDDRTFVRVPDFSLQRRAGALERNLLHMFTLYTRGAETEPRRVEHDLLWGMVRWMRAADGTRERRLWPLYASRRSAGGTESSWSLLGGLVGRDRHDGRGRWRYLWFFGGEGRPAAEEAAP